MRKSIVMVLTLAVVASSVFAFASPVKAEQGLLGNVATSLPSFCETGSPTVGIYYSHDGRSGYVVQARLLKPGAEEWDTQGVYNHTGMAFFDLTSAGGEPYPDYTLFTVAFRLARIDVQGNYILLDERAVDINCTTGEVQDPPLPAETKGELYPVETVLPVIPEVAEPYEDMPYEGQTACAIFQVDWWGNKVVDPALLPDCPDMDPDETQVACLKAGGWSTESVEELGATLGLYQAYVSQHGLCGVFEK